MRSRPPEVRGMAPPVHGRRLWRTGGVHGLRASDGAARQHAGLVVAGGVATWGSTWEEKQGAEELERGMAAWWRGRSCGRLSRRGGVEDDRSGRRGDRG